MDSRLAMLRAMKSAQHKERRRAARRKPNPRTLCRIVLAEGTVRPATIRDLSVSGMGLFLRRALEPGLNLDVDLLQPLRAFSCRVPARVVHSCEQPGGVWKVGVAFVRELSPEEFQTLV